MSKRNFITSKVINAFSDSELLNFFSHFRRSGMDKICDYDEAFTRREMYEETGRCLDCLANPNCPMHIKALMEHYGLWHKKGGR